MRNLIVVPILLALAACQDASRAVSPLAPGQPLLSVTSHGGPPQLFSNDRRYRDAGSHPAVGRSGSATLYARALVGPNRRTMLDLSTAPFGDSATTPGVITQAVIKAYRNQQLLFTSIRRPAPVSPTDTAGYRGLAPGDLLQVTANIRGVDRTRTDVVSLTGTVRLRPDLAVTGVDLPATGTTSGPIAIFATVAERNGDVGAWTDCVLYQDGQELDRVHHMWVDAGSQVSCAFSIRFHAPATHLMTIRVQGTDPGDYDVGNDSAAGRIEITQGEPAAMSWYGYAFDWETSQSSRWDSRYTTDDGVVHEQGNESVIEHSHSQTTALWGHIPETVRFPVSLGLSQYTFDIAGGSSTVVGLDSTRYDALPADYTYVSDDGRTGQECVYRQDYSTGASVSLCSYFDPGTAISELTYYRTASVATYYSNSYVRTWYPDGIVEGWSDNYSCTDCVQGTLVPLNTGFGIDARVETGGGGVYQAHTRFPLILSEEIFDYPYTCDTSPIFYCSGETGWVRVWTGSDTSSTAAGS